MDTFDTLDDAQRARLVASLPAASNTRAATQDVSQCDTLAKAEAVIAQYVPTFPMPQGVPLPTWATECADWEWHEEDQEWSRFVARVGQVAGERIVIDAFQTVAHDGGPVMVTGIGTLLSDFDDRDTTPEELAQLGRWLTEAADSMRRDT